MSLGITTNHYDFTPANIIDLLITLRTFYLFVYFLTRVCTRKISTFEAFNTTCFFF